MSSTGATLILCWETTNALTKESCLSGLHAGLNLIHKIITPKSLPVFQTWTYSTKMFAGLNPFQVCVENI